jgi:DNA-binding MarR family transcriptional regulator
LLARQQYVWQSVGVPTDERRVSDHPGVDITEAPLGSLLLQVVRAHATLASSMLNEIGLTPPQELVLLNLQENGRQPQSALVRFLGRDRSTVTATLQAMERANLVTRTPSSTDARAMDVDLAPAGRAACPEIRRAWAELERRTFGHLDPAQRTDLGIALGSIRDALRAAR